MNELLSSPFFGILLSLIAFEIALYINRKLKWFFLNPLLLAIVFVILFLLITKIDLKQYQVGGDIINMLLGPATVALAIPLYQQLHYLKKYYKAILLGVFIGSSAGMIATLIGAYLLKLDPTMIASLLPKSITTPIGIEVSASLGGITSITVFNIIVTGMIGAVLAEVILKAFKIHHPIAKGIAIGTSSHALGTSKAFEIGEIEGAMSSLSIGLAGIFTVFMAPILWEILLMFI